jgi:pimeloyl-ACP methyl ester carboxylesterase
VLQAFGDGTIFGETYGTGPIAVVWLHGWGRTHQDFAAAAHALAGDGIASVALDLPGFGASPLPNVRGGAQLYADLVTTVLEGLGVDRVTLVGHSFGGRIATVLAATSPDLVHSLVLTGAPLLRRAATARPARRYQVVRWLHAQGLLRDATMETYRQRYGSADYRAASGLLRDILVTTVNESYEQELPLVQAPTALVWGRDDHDVPLAVMEQALTLLRVPSTVTVLEDCGHLVPSQRPAELAAVVRDMVRAS